MNSNEYDASYDANTFFGSLPGPGLKVSDVGYAAAMNKNSLGSIKNDRYDWEESPITKRILRKTKCRECFLKTKDENL